MTLIRSAAWLLAGAAMLALPARSDAHPHEFIDLETRIEIDAKGRLTGFTMRWTFDLLYSVLLLQDLLPLPGQPEDPAMWQEKALEYQGNLAEYDFMAELTIDDRRLALAATGTPVLEEIDDRVALTFTVAPAAPVPVTGRALTYRVFDPSYYISIAHPSVAAIALAGAGAGTCAVTLVPPNPPADAVLLAASLDITQSGGTGLGRLFAERADITCGAEG